MISSATILNSRTNAFYENINFTGRALFSIGGSTMISNFVTYNFNDITSSVKINC